MEAVSITFIHPIARWVAGHQRHARQAPVPLASIPIKRLERHTHASLTLAFFGGASSVTYSHESLALLLSKVRPEALARSGMSMGRRGREGLRFVVAGSLPFRAAATGWLYITTPSQTKGRDTQNPLRLVRLGRALSRGCMRGKNQPNPVRVATQISSALATSCCGGSGGASLLLAIGECVYKQQSIALAIRASCQPWPKAHARKCSRTHRLVAPGSVVRW